MINLVVDIGNSAAKIAVFSRNKILFTDKSLAYSVTDFQQLKEKFQVNNLMISSVKKDISLDEDILKQDFNYIRFNHTLAIPIKNEYQSPSTLGLDRLAAVIGAYQLFPHQSVLVIDAGTCITYENLDKNGTYLGGSISPGLKMRLDAMHHFTSKLPQVHFEDDIEDYFGKNTQEAMLSGVLNGIAYEAEGFIKQQLKEKEDLKIILCGGDAAFFDSRFKNSIFAHSILNEPNLVLIGLNKVVNYQHDIK
ncbi:MAG: type III pantothenate kinase [Sphingobacteriales bacterium]|nr:type III pantothenate kinase [Sphingobacteriales bacterium]